jgi:hypothetical protein
VVLLHPALQVADRCGGAVLTGAGPYSNASLGAGKADDPRGFRRVQNLVADEFREFIDAGRLRRYHAEPGQVRRSAGSRKTARMAAASSSTMSRGVLAGARNMNQDFPRGSPAGRSRRAAAREGALRPVRRW